jgi:hypothetical protein
MGGQASAYQIAKKKKERRVIEVARGASEIIPAGELRDFDEPDFRLETANGFVGIEITAVMPTPYSDWFSSPLAEQLSGRRGSDCREGLSPQVRGGACEC